MKNGWTGGQYSILRALFGAWLAVHFVALMPRANELFRFALPVLVVASLAAVLFAIGLFDRLAAVVMLCVLASLVVQDPPIDGASLFAGWLLLAHTFLPPSPYGSWSARKRVDPRGGWRMPPAIFAATWIVWLALVLLSLMKWTDVRLSAGMVVLHLFLFDPAWIRRRAPETTDTVFYDGTCGLCHRSVRLVLAEDASGTAFNFSPLGGERFIAEMGDMKELPDSVLVRTAEGKVLERSDAVVRILGRLGGWWRVFGAMYGVIPARVRNAMYDFVARVRYRIFGRAKDACPLLPPDLRTRFSA